MELAAELLCMTGRSPDRVDAEQRVRTALSSGAAAERFARMVSMLGGPADLLEHPDAHLACAPVQRAVLSSASGHVMRSAEHTSELQSLMRISYAVFSLKKK